MEELLILLGFIILGIFWLVFTYLIPILLIILIVKGVTYAWILLTIWFIGFTVTNVMKEVKYDKKPGE